MNKEQKKKFAVGISFGLHALLVAAAFHMVIVTFTPMPRETGSLIRVKIDSRPYSPPKGDLRSNEVKEKPLDVIELQPTAPQAMEETLQPSFEHSSLTPRSEQEESLIAAPSSPAEVVTEQGTASSAHSPATARNVQSRVITADDVLKGATASSAHAINRESIKPVAAAYGVPEGDVGAGTLSGVAASGEQGLQGTQDHNLQIPFEHKINAKDIKSFLGYELQTYEDPADHVKYFRLSIRVEDTQVTLPTIPKEIVFLVDSSNSIGPERLQQYKQGIRECLNHLGLSDKFNIMVFKKTVVKFAEQSVERNPSNLGNAADFIQAFESGSKTDVYDAVFKSIDLKNPMKPAYILLLSDGQPTEGVTNPQQIINQIARINKGRVPVFAFGGGSFVNQYLLDFLSFTNRGWAEFHPYQINKRIMEMYNRIKDPVLLDLRYYVSGLDEKEIYPKLLPDFFRGSKFVLYGRFTNEKTFFLSLMGDAQNEVKQYRITDDLTAAGHGDREIARNWASRKVYHLVSLIEYDKDNKALLDEINALAQKFDLKIPNIGVK